MRLIAPVVVGLAAAGLACADVVLFSPTNPAAPLLADATAYTPDLGSVLNFAPQSLPVVYIDQVCDETVVATIPAGAAVAFNSDACDVGKSLAYLRQAGVKVAVELFQPLYVTTGPNDVKVDYAYSPYPENIMLDRIHGPASHQAYVILTSPNATNLWINVTYLASPWSAFFVTWPYVLYEVIDLLFFGAYVIPHAIWSLVIIVRERNKTMNTHNRFFGFNMQSTIILISLFVGVFRCVSVGLQMVQLYLRIWIPIFLTLLLEGYCYMLMLLTMLLLILYWSDLLVAAKARITMIQRPNQLLFVFLLILSIAVTTIAIFYYIYKYPYWDIIKQACFGALGVIAFAVAFFAIIYGTKIIRQLRTTTTQVTHRKSSLAVPSSSPVVSDNPMFAESTRKGSRSSLKIPRLSLAREGGSTKLDDAETRAQKAALKRAQPMTRLLVVVAIGLLCEVLVAIAAALSWALAVPETFLVVFALDLFFEMLIYGLVLYTVSPIWQELRRRRRRSSGAGLQPVDEDEVEKHRTLNARLYRILCCWLNRMGVDDL